MRRSLVIALCLAVLAPVVRAQDDQQVKVILQQETELPDYFEVRVGLWFPKDKEKGFTIDDASLQPSNVDAKIDQSQAVGLDFHYRTRAAHPVYVDFAVGAWYSTYNWNPSAEFTSHIENVDAWSVVVPLTVGISVNPIPENPLQPYAMAGIGLYTGISGRKYKLDSGLNRDENKRNFAFGGYVGAGLDFFFLPSFGASIGLKYQIVNFKEYLYSQQKDFTGLQVQAGIATAI